MKNRIKVPTTYLEELSRHDLKFILINAEYAVVEKEGEIFGRNDTELIIYISKLLVDGCNALPNSDKKKILDSITRDSSETSLPNLDGSSVLFVSNPSAEADSKAEAISILYEIVSILSDTATGQKQIQKVNDKFGILWRKAKQRLQCIGREFPFDFENLWDWFHFYKSNFSTYAERRHFLSEEFKPIIGAFLEASLILPKQLEPTGWDLVDRGLSKARAALLNGKHEEDFQTVGLLCRETLVSLGQAVYDPNIHPSFDGVDISETDFKRQIEAYIACILKGSKHENLRKFVKSSFQVSNDIQHRRTANYTLAALCFEATSASVNTIRILANDKNKISV